MKVTIIDCFDSFSYNLFQMVGCLGGEPQAVTCDRSLDQVSKTDPDCIILSPGPGKPEDAGICTEVIREFGGNVPILGVCLGHQTILHTFGGRVSRMKIPVHGKTSTIIHTGKGVFLGLPNPFTATRYHSLAVSPEDIPEEFETLAVSAEDFCLMAVRHRDLPITGVQFHPESIMTHEGMRIMKNFLLQGGAK